MNLDWLKRMEKQPSEIYFRKLLENGQYRIHLQYYIFEEGELTIGYYFLFERKILHKGVEV